MDKSETFNNHEFVQEGLSLIKHRVRYTCYFTIPLFLLYNFLDQVMFPTLAHQLLVIRLMIGAIHLVLYGLTFTKIGERFPVLLGMLVYVSIGWSIAWMCLLTGGRESPYYAGLILVTIGFGIMMPWRLRDSVVTALLINGFYLAIVLAFDARRTFSIFINNNFFLWGTTIISVISSNIWTGYRWREFLDRSRLKSLDQSKSNFLSVVSHELKTPITLIAGPIEQALSHSSGGEVRLSLKVAELIRRNTHRLATLISDLIEISRGEVGKQELNPVEIQNVGQYLREIFDSIEPLFQEKEIRFRLEIQNNLQAHEFDRRKIDKVIYNLLTNALKFTPRGGAVLLKAKDLQKESSLSVLQVCVEDTGVGIPQEKIKNIFERFIQVEEGNTRSFEGMGVGLSLARDFVHYHGGQIFVKSVVGQGSSFTVELPRGKNHFQVPIVNTTDDVFSEKKLDFTRQLVRENQVVAPREIQKSHVKSGASVLIVDDNQDLRSTLVDILNEDYSVLTATQGAEALSLMETVLPALVISDIMMPVMNGYELCQNMKKNDRLKNIPIILLTAKAGEESLAMGFESGAYDYLGKPFSPQELKLRVQNLMAIQEMKAEMVRQQNLASIGILSAGISHNMNTYTASLDIGLENLQEIIGSQEILKSFSTVQKAQIQSGFKNAREAVSSMKNMIQSLEVYSQKNREGFRETDCVATTRSVIQIAQNLLPDSVNLIFEAPEEFMATYNPHTLNPALMNLIDNAMDVSPSGGSVRFSISHDDEFVLFQVADQGPGIPEKIQQRIWEPYFTTKDVQKGTGLGLWMVKRAVEDEHRGRVWFETSVQGTTFFVKIPRQFKG